MAKQVMFIHGAWQTSGSWGQFRSYFEGQGIPAVAPEWPSMDRPAAALKASPSPELAGLGITELVDSYARKVQAIDEPPLLFGHSFGGLVVQMLLDRGLGAAGIALSPAPPKGIMPEPTAVRASLGVFLNWKGWSRVLTMPEKAFRWGFGNELTEDQQRRVYAEDIVPAPGRIFYQQLLGRSNAVTWDNPARPPLLLVAAGKDRTVEARMVRSNFKKAQQAPSQTSILEYPDACHVMAIQDGWEQIASDCLDWARTVTGLGEDAHARS